jgi:nicotinamide-nucleotide amidase
MKTELLSVGTELLLGNIVNTDARDISIMLSELGIDVYWHTVVGDNPERLTQAVEVAKKRADLIITTGGLGPTCDDLTKQVLAKAFDLKLYFDEHSAQRIRSYFQKRSGITMTDNNMQQAMLPVGCTVLDNDWGTAPGCVFLAQGVRVIMLPGPPRECNAMMRHRVMPYLQSLSQEHLYTHNLRVFGSGESAVEALLRPLMNRLSNPTLAPYAKEGEVLLRLTAKAPDPQAAETPMAPVLEEVRKTLGGLIYGTDVDSLEQLVLQLLGSSGETLAAAESCTGGLLAQRITAIPGASSVFKGGATVYTNEAKTALLGVDPDLIRTHTPISPEVARAMATGIRNVLQADFGLGITGLAGPEGDGLHPVGTIFVAMAAPDTLHVRELRLGDKIDRERARILAVNHAFDLVRRYKTGLPLDL